MASSEKKIFSHLSIRKKLILAFVAVALIPVLVLGSFSLLSSRRALQDSAIIQVHASLAATVERIQDTLRHAEKDLRLLTHSPSVITFAEFFPDNVIGKDNLNRMLVSALENFAERHPLYRRIWLVTDKGEQILQLRREEGRLIMEGMDASRDLSNEAFFWQALDSRRGEVVVTSRVPEGRSAGNDEVTLTYSTAVYDRGQKRKAVLAIQMWVQDLSVLSRPDGYAMGNTYLLDADGDFLYSIDAAGRRLVQRGFVEMFDEQTIHQILSGEAGMITGEKDRLISYAPIDPGLGGMNNFWVVVSELSRSVVLAPVRRFLIVFGATLVALILLGSLAGIAASHHFTRPLLQLHRGAQIIANEDFDHRITVHTKDEIEELAEQFNQMAFRLKKSQRRLTSLNQALQKEVERRTEQLFQAEKMAAVGGLSAGIAHEIGNPLASMKTNIQLLAEKLGQGSEHQKFLDRMVKEINRLNHFFKTFSTFAKPARPQRISCDIRKVIQEMVLFIKPEASAQGVTIRQVFDREVPHVLVDVQRMQQVFLNLFLNAMQAMQDGGAVTVTVRAEPDEGEAAEEAGEVWVTVSDTGPGIPEDNRSKIFEPFFTTKAEGTGLGLSIAHQIITESGGTIAVAHAGTRGASFTIRLKAQETAIGVG
jgi:signal transduction histidine kinase